MASSITEAKSSRFRHLTTGNVICMSLDEPAVRGPEPGARSLCAEQLHGRDGVVEEVAKAKHGTNQNS